MIYLEDHLSKSDFLSQLPGIWRFRRSFGLPIDAPISYLGEGNTPLIPKLINGRKVYLKMESQNPTLSYKDRGTAVLTSMLRSKGIDKVVEDSSGNAGASLATYCAAFGINAEIYVPEDTSGPKLAQISSTGAKITRIPGTRDKTTEAVLSSLEKSGLTYASHAYQPFGLAGIATIAYEIYEQLHDTPDRVIAPIGHGSLFLGIMLGFKLLLNSGLISKIPQFIGVQAANCSPFYHRWACQDGTPIFFQTLAEGVRVRKPIRGDMILSILRQDNDKIVIISEEELQFARQELSQNGIFIEPTSALVWAAEKKLPQPKDISSVLIMTGYGLKSSH